MSSTEITEIEAIESKVSDHKPIITNTTNIANQEISNKIWRKYIYSSEYKASEENITKLLQTGWPNENSEQTKRLMQNKLILRPVIKLQDRSTKILKENTKWELKVTKLNDLRKEDFINTIKTLNMNSKVDRSRFHNTLNWIFKFKVKEKISKGIKTEEGIIHGKEKDKLIKIYFEKLFAANTTKIEIRNNAIFNYKYDIKRAISSISRSKAVGIDGIPSKALVQEINSPLMIKIEKWFKEWIIKGEIPDYLTQGRLILISKDNTKNPVINDTRPVTILPAITKFFETTI